MEVGVNHAWSGSRYIDVTAPRPEDIDLSEIAVGLSREQRFRGSATRAFWSVAQHSLLALRLAEDDGMSAQVRRAVLMHDASEYLLGDLLRPVKVNCPDYKRLESRWEEAILIRFGLFKTAGFVKHYDNLALAVEKAELVSPRAGRWAGIQETNRRIPAWICDLDPDEAADEFLRAAARLGIEPVNGGRA